MEEQAEYITDAAEMMGWNEPKQIITEISGFVPIFDCVLEKYKNATRAIVHGAMWRFCRMKDGVCKASLTTIGEMTGLAPATIMRHAQVLCEDGYFVDLTPDLKNKPHVYADTGKVKMVNRFDVSQRNVSISQRNASVSESQLNKVLNKDNNKQSTTIDAGLIFRLYETNIGLVHNVTLSQEIGEYAELPVPWLEYAFKQAADANARNWRYVRAILDNCKATNGIPVKKNKQPAQPKGVTVAQSWLEKKRKAENVNA